MTVETPAPCEAEVYSGEKNIEEWMPELLGAIRGEGPVLDPEFFLASVDRNAWKPYVTAVRRGGRLIGVVYAKERTIRGVQTGLLYADDVLGGMVAANRQERGAVLQAGLGRLLARPGIRGLRLAIDATRFDASAFRQAAAGQCAELRLVESRSLEHTRLALPRTYEQFLSGLRQTTRHNFRYYRRRSEEAGNVYCKALTIEQFRQAAEQLAPRCSISCSTNRIERSLNMLAALPRPLLIGLQSREGTWLSVVGGWQHDNAATFLCQLNSDRDHRNDSLAVVLRAYLIESLIRRGADELSFWGGVSGALGHYAKQIPAIHVYMDNKSLGWKAVRALVGQVGRLLPQRGGAIAQWVMPASDAAAVRVTSDQGAVQHLSVTRASSRRFKVRPARP